MTALARSKKEKFSGFTNDSAQPPTESIFSSLAHLSHTAPSFSPSLSFHTCHLSRLFCYPSGLIRRPLLLLLSTSPARPGLLLLLPAFLSCILFLRRQCVPLFGRKFFESTREHFCHGFARSSASRTSSHSSLLRCAAYGRCTG